MHEFCERFLLSLPSVAIIGDESTYIAGHKSIRTERALSMARMAEYRYALSGSPALEGPLQLFTQYEFLDPAIIGIGDYYAFRNRYAVMGGYTPKEGKNKGKPLEIIGYQNIDELSALIAPHTVEVSKSDAYDLPPKRYEVRTVEPTKEQKEIYRKIKKDEVLVIPGQEDKAIQNVLELALRLHQVAGGYTVSPREETRFDKYGNPKVKVIYDPIEVVNPERNPKIMEIKSIIEEIRGTKQGIIWATYRPEIDAITKTLRAMGLRIGELHGGIHEDDRQPMVDAFKAGDIDWIVGNASTGGMGYTMMSSEVNIFYNNTFKAVDRVQAEDRAWGDGQTKSGIWIDLIAEHTVDQLVIKALTQKQDVSDYVKKNLQQAIKLLDGDEDD
jgi:SNF2 family DNA or RNA helicase